MNDVQALKYKWKWSGDEHVKNMTRQRSRARRRLAKKINAAKKKSKFD